jgi:hypothetical protein
MQFVITAEHPPQLCPSSNGKIRDALKQGAPHIPDIAQKHGVQIITLNVFGPDHVIVSVVEAGSIEAVRSFVTEAGLYQWNTVKINATWSLEEALQQIEDLPTIF